MVVGQSGNPSAAFNACLYGAIQEAKQSPEIQNIYGMVNGMEGLLKGDFIDLGRQQPATLEGLKNASIRPTPFQRQCPCGRGLWSRSGNLQKI